jgi:phosphoribosylamine--glycine ligase
MKLLIIGSGGREHSICQNLLKSIVVNQIFVAPGNPGIGQSLEKVKCLGISATNISALLEFALSEKIDLTIVGPEISLSLGIVDEFKKNNLLIVGPTKEGSQLESSKHFAKKLMNKKGISTAAFEVFEKSEEAVSFMKHSKENKWVVKADGLASGKGVILCQNNYEAILAIQALMDGEFLGERVEKILIEEFLEGQEFSAFALCDQTDFVFLGTACDHKRLLDNNLGPNTGGMGAYAPAEFLSDEECEWIKENVFNKIILSLNEEKINYNGFLFAGLMKTNTGIKVIEFNARMGDPETQTLFPLFAEDLLPWLMASATNKMKFIREEKKANNIQLTNKKSVHVVMASKGYPGVDGQIIETGDLIEISNEHMNDLNRDNDINIYFAGVRSNEENVLVTGGGRILGVTAIAESYLKAREKAYGFVKKIKIKNVHYRSDIAQGVVSES